MLALGLGLSAAVIWACHDLLARKLSQGAALLPIILIVLASGCLVLLGPALLLGDWPAMSPAAAGLAALAGLGFAIGIGSLYKAFSIAPVRLVAPIIGAYPMLSLGIAAMQGRPVMPIDWLAVGFIVIGIAIVAIATREDVTPEQGAPSPLPAMLWAGLSGAGFAATFALGQEAARQGAHLPTILITRLVALSCIAALALARRAPVMSLRYNLPILALMGVMDAVALALVTASGRLPMAEYASVSSSLFGVLTVLLARWLLREQVRGVQWAGIATVFTGIAVLTLQG